MTLRRLALLGLVVFPLVLAGCGTGGIGDEQGDVARGKELFVNGEEGKQACSTCHVLEDAGATGIIGPDLDASFGPARQEGFKESTIREIVRQQIKFPASERSSPDVSAMPANLVTGENVDAVAAYVARCAGNTDKSVCPGPAAGGGGPKSIFTSSCGSCHVLSDAGTSGTIGPNLDEAKPSLQSAIQQITNGGGGMPAFKDQLSEAQIKALAEYIVRVTGGGGG